MNPTETKIELNLSDPKTPLTNEEEALFREWASQDPNVAEISIGAIKNMQKLFQKVFSTLDCERDLLQKYAIALTAFVNKIDQIAENDSFKSMQSWAYVHGHRYDGPNWKQELESAKELLKS